MSSSSGRGVSDQHETEGPFRNLSLSYILYLRPGGYIVRALLHYQEFLIKSDITSTLYFREKKKEPKKNRKKIIGLSPDYDCVVSSLQLIVEYPFGHRINPSHHMYVTLTFIVFDRRH